MMSNVIAFHRRLPIICSEISQKKVDEAQSLLNGLLARSMIACPACAGRGVMLFKNPTTGLLDHALCPCGGTDEDRIDLNDFDGVA